MRISVNILITIVLSLLFCYGLDGIHTAGKDAYDPDKICQINAINQQICYLENGVTYLKQNVTLNHNNFTIILECGQIKNCEYCQHNNCCLQYNVGVKLPCYRDKQNQYHVDNLLESRMIFYRSLTLLTPFFLTLLAVEEKQIYVDISTKILRE